MKVFFNGELISISQAPCTPSGWLEGQGIFETIKTVDSKPWALSRHMRRALISAANVGISLPPEGEIREAISQLLHTQTQERGLLRLSFALNGHWLAFHTPYQELTKAAVVKTASHDVTLTTSTVKLFPYTQRLELLQAAQKEGCDELFLFNIYNKLCEGAVTNIVVKIEEQWITPPIADGVLPGVMRALVIENCEVLVRSIDRSEIDLIESAMLMSSLRIAQSVASVDGRELRQSEAFKSEIEAMALRTSIG